MLLAYFILAYCTALTLNHTDGMGRWLDFIALGISVVLVLRELGRKKA